MARVSPYTRAYMPVIRRILEDLKIDMPYSLQWNYSRSYQGAQIEGRNVRIRKNMGPYRTIEVLMHELRHQYQEDNGLYQNIGTEVIDGKSKFIALWKGERYVFHEWSLKNKEAYYSNPWEIDAREYESTMSILFPDIHDMIKTVKFGLIAEGLIK